MSIAVYRLASCLGLTLLVSVASAGSFGQLCPGNAPDRFCIAKTFLKSVYPELSGEHLTLTLVEQDFSMGGSPAKFAFTLQEPCAGMTLNECRSRPALLTGEFTTLGTQLGTLESFRAAGRYVNTERQQKAVAEVRDHQNWTDRDICAVLSQEGAKYPCAAAKEIFKSHLSLANLQHVLGKFQVRDVRFEARSSTATEGTITGDLPVTLLQWQVEAEQADEVNHEVRKYVLIFEPFEGRLIGVQRQLE